MSKTLKLISLGARGVGKTVFLISNCADALRANQASTQDSQWFECRDQKTKDNVEKLLAYVSQNNAYPPATFKSSDFNISLKQKSMGNVKTLCDVEWIDIPGEWCTLDNQDFQASLLESHGCCVFVDADALINNPAYAQSLQQIIQQIEAIASLIRQNSLVQYPIALICTKYDLVHSKAIGLIKLEEKLQPLIQSIKSNHSLYRQFYSAIPLLKKEGKMIQKTNANKALFWITSELNRIHDAENAQNLGQVLSSIVLDKDGTNETTSERRLIDFSNPKKTIAMAVAACAAIAGLAALSLVLMNPKSASNSAVTPQISGFKKVLKTDPNNKSAIQGIVDTYSRLGAYEDAISELQVLHEENPDSIPVLESLVTLYNQTDQPLKEEEYYDKILALEGNNFVALLGKAQLKAENGETKAAIEILDKAEKTAKNPAFKAEIKRMSQEILNSK